MSSTKLRRALRAKFGSRKYRLTRDDYVHVYGRMPNSNVTGWYVLGTRWGVETMIAMGAWESDA